MTVKHLLVLLALAAIWGGSFLLLRIAAPEFGVIPLIALRVCGAALVMLPFMFWRGASAELGGNWGVLTVLALTNTAIPFSLFAFATLSLTAGFTSVLNSVAPMSTALIGFLWLKDRFSVSATVGLMLGVVGVAFLAQDSSNLASKAQWLAALAAVTATFLYGFAANYTKEFKGSMSALAIAGGHLVVSALIMLPAGLYFWPEMAPSQQAWLAVAGLSIVCTALATLMYFWLLNEVSAHQAMSVTFMMPMFGMFWGYMFADENVTSYMLIGCAIILFAVALTAGLFERKKVAA